MYLRHIRVNIVHQLHPDDRDRQLLVFCSCFLEQIRPGNNIATKNNYFVGYYL